MLAAVSLAGLLPLDASAQTVTATTDTTCLGQRAGSTLQCVANDVTANPVFELPAGSCRVGQDYTIASASFQLSKGSPERYDIGLFFGQQGNVPSQTTSGNTCSVAAFTQASTGLLLPAPDPPWALADVDQCWDMRAGVATANVTVQNIKVSCQPDPVTGDLQIPYTVSWYQNSNLNCSSSTNVRTDAGSKCRTGTGVAAAVSVLGYVRVTKQTVPDGATQTFNFTASGAVTPSPAAFSLSDDQERYVEMDLNGSSRSLTITEAAAGGAWNPTASISCTDTAGAPLPASFYSKNEANRTFTVSLSANSNNGVTAAHCTITNSRQTRVRTSKALSPTTDAGRFNLTAGGTTVNNQGHGGTTGYVAVAAGAPQTFSETAFTGTTSANYTAAYQCVNDLTGATVSSGSGATVSFVPPANADTTCTFANARKQASLTMRKTWSGAVVNDTATLNATGLINNVAGFVSTANSASETDTAPTVTAYAGETATLSETLGSGNAGLYHQALACTGAADTNPADGLAIGANDTAITCTYTNTRHSADLAITKTNNQTTVIPGTTTTYQVTVTNNGPDPVTGATVSDLLPGAPLNCPAGNAVVCSGAEACPSPLTVGDLANGAVLGTLVNDASVTLSFTCNVEN